MTLNGKMMFRGGNPQRRAQAMQMEVSGPTLTPIPQRGPETYFEYKKMSAKDKAHCESRIREMLGSGMVTCLQQEEYFQMMAVLRENRCEAARKDDYDRCDQLDDLMRQLSDYFLENKLYMSKAERVYAIQSQLEAVKAKLETAEKHWEERDIDMKIARDSSVQQRESECNSSLSTYDGKMPGNLPPEFCKLSPETLNLYEQEKQLVASRRFKEAAMVHIEFLARKKYELERKKDVYYQKFEKGRTQVEVRNSKRKQATESNWDRKINNADHNKTKEIEALREAVRNLESKLISAKAEYIGEDDPILAEAKEGTDEQIRFSLAGTERPMKRSIPRASTARTSQRMQVQNRKIDSTRWPPKRT